MNGKNALLLMAGILAVLFFMATCSPKEQQRYSSGVNIKVGSLPDDICYVDGIPQIIGINMDEGDQGLIYIRNNGDIVLANWMTYGSTYRRSGEFYWTGGVCPIIGDEDNVKY